MDFNDDFLELVAEAITMALMWIYNTYFRAGGVPTAINQQQGENMDAQVDEYDEHMRRMIIWNLLLSVKFKKAEKQFRLRRAKARRAAYSAKNGRARHKQKRSDKRPAWK